jgi:anti-anti-sigma factor
VEEAAFFKEAEGIGYVRTEGHMTALLCPGLKARILASLDSPNPPLTIAFDLSACEYMDSTFLGLIVGVCKRLGAPHGRKVILHGTNEACLGLLRTIGVLGLVEVAEGPAPALEGMEPVGGGTKATARFLLDAHEELSKLSEDNRERFAALSTALRGALGEDGKRNESR